MTFKRIGKAEIRKFISTTRFRTTIWYTLLFLALEIIFAFSVYTYMYSNSLEKLDAALKMQAQKIQRLVDEKQVDFENFEPDENYSSPEDVLSDILYDVVIFDKRNYFIQITQGRKNLFHTKNLKTNIIKSPESKKPEISQTFDFEDSDIADSEMRCYQLVDKKLKIIVAYPKEIISQTLGSLRDIIIILSPIFVIIALGGGAVISRKSLSRIDAIIKKTEEITAQKLNEQIPGGEYNDEYGRLVNKMNEMIERIKISVDFMNQFSISAAHELKTPLTILRGEIEIALKSVKTPEQYIETLNSNYEETIRLIKIIDNLFFISKSDNKLIKLEKIETDIKEFLNLVVNSLRLIGVEKGIELHLDAKETAIVQIDAVLFKQALLNLIDNAVKYGYENRPIIISTELRENKELVIAVINEGDGIPAEMLDKIFDRFFRIESSRNRKTGGVGLGLSVVKSVVALHGGTLHVTSVQLGKTAFKITLPVV